MLSRNPAGYTTAIPMFSSCGLFSYRPHVVYRCQSPSHVSSLHDRSTLDHNTYQATDKVSISGSMSPFHLQSDRHSLCKAGSAVSQRQFAHPAKHRLTSPFFHSVSISAGPGPSLQVEETVLEVPLDFGVLEAPRELSQDPFARPSFPSVIRKAGKRCST
jgi:hypothetical protein